MNFSQIINLKTVKFYLLKHYVLIFAILFILSALLSSFFLKEVVSLVTFFDIEIKFLFTENVDSLHAYFPNLYLFVFLATRFIKFGLPFLILFIIFYKRTTLINKVLEYTRIPNIQDWAFNSILFLFFSLSFTLIIYCFGTFDFSTQLLLSRNFLVFLILFNLILLITNVSIFKTKLLSFLLKPALPYSIGITRILFFSYLLFLYAFAYTHKIKAVQGLSKVELPTVGWLIEIIPVNNHIHLIFTYLGILACMFIIIGYKTRIFLLLNCFIVFYIVATPNFFGKLWHEQIIIWIAWILAFSNCYDVLSVDSLLNKKAIIKSSKYNFHLRLIWIQFGLIYFFAGFYKLWLCGFDWALSQSMINQIHLEWFENYNKIPSIRIDTLPILLKISGLAVILFEMLYIFLLFNKNTRFLSIWGGLIMHIAIELIMYISFFTLFVVFYLIFIPWNFILEKLKLIQSNYEVSAKNISFLSPLYIFPIIIICMNFIYGVFRIDSYPFSVYPVYAAIVPETFKFLDYEILDEKFKHLNVHQLGKEMNFSWESYSRFEPIIIEQFENSGIVDTNNIEQQWLRWQNVITVLDEVDSVKIYAVEVYLDPNKQTDTIHKYPILNLFLNEDKD